MARAIVEPRAFTARDGDERQTLVMLHLRTRMPYGLQAAGNPIVIGAISAGWRLRSTIVGYLSVQSPLRGMRAARRAGFMRKMRDRSGDLNHRPVPREQKRREINAFGARLHLPAQGCQRARSRRFEAAGDAFAEIDRNRLR